MTKTNRTTNNTASFRTYQSGKRFLLPTGCGVEMGDRVTFSFIRGVDKATGKPFTFVKFTKSLTGHKVGMRGNRLLVQTGRHGIPGLATASLIYRAEFGGWLVEDGQQPTANAAAHTPIIKSAANANTKLAPLPRGRSLVVYEAAGRDVVVYSGEEEPDPFTPPASPRSGAQRPSAEIIEFTPRHPGRTRREKGEVVKFPANRSRKEEISPANDNAGQTNPVSYSDEWFAKTVPYLSSLFRDGNWEKRRRVLMGDVSVVKTNAGEQCYTESALLHCVLRAAGQDRFCADYTAMNDNNTYGPHKGKVKRAATGKQKDGVFCGVPTVRNHTIDAGPLGSLTLDWNCRLGWFNPPFGMVAWATFLEKANYEVEAGNAEVLVGFVPVTYGTNNNFANNLIHTPNSFEIILEGQISMWKEALGKVGEIAGARLMVYGGKKPGFKKFLTNLLNKLEAEGFIRKGYAAHRHHEIAFRSDWQ